MHAYSLRSFVILTELSDSTFLDSNMNLKKFNETHVFELGSIKGNIFCICAYKQFSKVMIKNNKIISHFDHFISTVAKIDDIKIQYIFSLQKSLGYLQNFRDNLLRKRAVEMSINTNIISVENTPSLMTYEHSGECIIVPIQRDHMITRWIFFQVRL